MQRIISLLLLSLTAASLTAQVSYPGSDYAAPGDTFVYSSADFTLADFTTTGASLNWNYASLSPSDQQVLEFTDPDNAGYESSWITQCVFSGGNPFSCPGLWDDFTNLSLPSLEENAGLLAFLPIPIEDWTRHFKASGSEVSEVMLGVSIGGAITLPFIVEFEVPDTMLRFPLTYQQVDSAASSWGVDLSATGQGIKFFREQTRYNEVQGWGTLVTPYDSFPDVLKVRTEIQRSDSIELNDTTIVLPTRLVEYSWYAPGFGQPVLRAQGNIVAGLEVISQVQYIDTLRCLTPEVSFLPLPNPVILNGDGEGNVTFFNTSGATDSVSWDFGDGTFSGLNSPQHTYTANGTYQVTLIGCNTVCDPLECDTFNLPILVIDTTIANAVFETLRDTVCVGDSLDFINLSTFSNGFSWNFGDGNTSTERNPSHAFSAEGSYEVQLIAFNTGANDTATQEIYVKEAPGITLTPDTTMMRGDSLTLTATLSGSYASYYWEPELGQTLTPRISPDSTTTYMIFAENECGNDSAQVTVSVTRNTGIATIEGEIMVYPNPSAGLFRVEFPTPSARQWQVFDASGKLVDRGQNSQEAFEIDLSPLPSGLYSLLVNEDKGYHQQILIRQ